jgi:hypothetical protein
MNIGQVYIVDGKAVMPISVPDLEGYFLQIEIPLDKSTMGQYPNHPIFEGAASFLGGKTLNVRRANEYMERTNNGIKNLSAVIANTKNNKTYVSTYVPISTTPLSIGDDFVEIANNTAYTVFGYFPKEVAVGAGIGNQKTIKLYPYGINVQPMMEYIDSVTSSKLGLSEICKDKDTKKGLADTSKKSIEDLAVQNSRLPFAAANYQKPNNLLYVKQDRPAKVVQPIRVMQKKAKGQKLVTTQSVGNTLSDMLKVFDEFDSTKNRLGYTFDDSQKVERFKQWQENNFISPQPPAFSLTGNKLLDDFTFVTVASMPEQDNLFGVLISPYFLMPKNQPNVKKYSLDKIGNHNAYIDTSGSQVHYNGVWKYTISGIELLDECVKTEDYSRYVKVNNFGKDFLSFKNLSGDKAMYRNVDNHGIIKYFGGGLFSCLQNNEQPVSGDMYGVGDIFTVTKNGSSREMVVLYMYYALDKKQNKKKICVCLAYEHLAQMEMETGKNSEPLFHIEADWLEANATNHKSYFEARKKIKDFYLYEGATKATAAGTTPVSPYQEYKDLLGEEYDDEFLSAVSQLDWMRINEVQKVKPEIMDAVKVIVSELYLAYLKDKANRPKTQEASNEEINFGKYYYDLNIDNNTKEVMQDILTNMAQLLGDDVKNYFTYIKPEEISVAANVDLDDVKNYMNAGIGSQEDLRKVSTQGGWHKNKQTIIFQEKQEPVLQVILRSRMDIGDSEIYVTVTNLMNENKRFSARSSKEVNYYQMYVGDAIMRYLVLVDYLQKSDYISDSKKKKMFPFVLTDYAIQKLQYMNRWGLFDTPEVMYERLVKQRSVGNLNSSFDDLNYFGNLMSIYVSYSTSIAYNSFEKAQEFIKTLRKTTTYDINDYLLDNKDAVISYLYSLPIDWGNKDAPYMITATTPTLVAPAKKRKSKTTTPEPPTTTTTPNEPFEWGGDWDTIHFSEVDAIKQSLGITVSDFTIKNRVFSIKTPTGIKEYIIVAFYPPNMPPNKEYEAYLQEVQDEETKYKTAPLYSLYKPLTEIAQGGEYDYTVIVPWDNAGEFRQKFIDKYAQTPTPPAPTTGSFKWLQEPWQLSLLKSTQEDFNSFYQLPSDATIQDCSFEVGYPTPSDPKEKFVLFAIPHDDTTEALYYKLYQYARGIDWNGLMNNNPEIGQAINSQIGNYYRFFCRENDYMNVIMDIQESIAKVTPAAPPTPPAPTTSPLTDIPDDYWEDVKATIPSIDSEEEFERILSKQRKTKDDKAAIASMFYDFYVIDSNNIHFDELVNSGLAEKGKRIYRIALKEGYDRMYFDFASLRQNTMSDFKSWIDDLIYPLLNDEIKAITLQRGMPYLRQIVAQVNGFTTTPTPKPTKPKTAKTPKPKKGKLSPEELSQSLDDIDLDF